MNNNEKEFDGFKKTGIDSKIEDEISSDLTKKKYTQKIYLRNQLLYIKTIVYNNII